MINVFRGIKIVRSKKCKAICHIYMNPIRVVSMILLNEHNKIHAYVI